ncbi:type II toxin-antitoxin system HicB family antitoxin [Desulfacinum infernum]|jgi:predicted RNase H-like HicB family nuclease
MLTDYIAKAMRRARYELLEDGSFYGEIPGFQGVFANEKTLDACREQLQEVLEEWIVLALAMDHTLPELDGTKPGVIRETA